MPHTFDALPIMSQIESPAASLRKVHMVSPPHKSQSKMCANKQQDAVLSAHSWSMQERMRGRERNKEGGRVHL